MKVKICNKCNVREKYGKSSLCYTCMVEYRKNSLTYNTICSRCFEKKAKSHVCYCPTCYKNINSKVKYMDQSPEFKVNLFIFIRSLEIGPADAIDNLLIAHYWSTITLFHHLYYKEDVPTQIDLMIKDIKEFLMGKKIRKIKK